MQEKLGKQFVDIVGSKTYVYTLIASPDGRLFNLVDSNHRLMFFYSIEENLIKEVVKHMREVSVD
jgi:hypothetical protein